MSYALLESWQREESRNQKQLKEQVFISINCASVFRVVCKVVDIEMKWKFVDFVDASGRMTDDQHWTF